MKVEVAVYSSRDTIIVVDNQGAGIASFLGFTTQFLPVKMVNELTSAKMAWATRMIEFETPSAATTAVKRIQERAETIVAE